MKMLGKVHSCDYFSTTANDGVLGDKRRNELELFKIFPLKKNAKDFCIYVDEKSHFVA